jgi:hypothetical protein
MNALVRRYFYEEANFEEVLVLSEGPKKNWSEIEQLAPSFPRGWFELSRIPAEDRVDFSCSFWLKRLPFNPKTHNAISEFFSALDDVGVVLSKKKETWTPQLVYSFMDNSCFFRGLPPANDAQINELKSELDVAFPNDWISFTKIHNGFGKLSELNLLKIEDIPSARRRVMEMLLRAPRAVRSGATVIDPGSLIPFFEVSGLSSFQCFYADWYPGNEMGNVYFSGIDYTVSDTTREKAWGDTGGFPNFLEWLASYLEGMEIAP